MSHMTISEAGRKIGLPASTIRYYEQIGVLKPAHRESGQRRYGQEVLYRLALIQRARQTGFTLDEIRRLFFGFSAGTPISRRWERLSHKKLKELDSMMRQIQIMRELLLRIQKCQCGAIEQCGKAMFEHGCSNRAKKLNKASRGDAGRWLPDSACEGSAPK